ncbi:hypothetical protein VTN77DRAFT_3698 [Rasamsonia byssochlamydoides]|uniref:uncharacterized protein n=1 Tax=Rasamsonia byssochlamydoides TaxID=89139 RepID=UPI00374469FF
MVALRETIAVVDKSGKVVSTSKHILGVFKEARNAYRERKAELLAEKHAERQAKIAEREARRAMAALTIDDRRSVASSRKTGKFRHHWGRSHHYEQDLDNEPPYKSLQESGRRHTTNDLMGKEPAPAISRSKTDVDMDLAYGEAHPSALQRYEPAVEPVDDPADEEELQGLIAKAQKLLDEADCMQHSATAMIKHLQKHPDAMAAVALTLAEISNIISKMAPGIIASLKASAPGIFALLASPQFLIAAGVGVGVTIVMFGGYKIIKKITATDQEPIQDKNPAQAPVATADELMELQSEHLSRVEMWRRGVADAEAMSVGTSVDGEYITPTAAAMSGIGLTTPSPSRVSRSKYEEMSMASSRRSKHSRRSRTSTRAGGEEKEKKKKKEKTKRSNKLKLLFTV